MPTAGASTAPRGRDARRGAARGRDTAIVTGLTDEQRLLRIQDELRTGFDALAHVGKAVSIFGSARTPRDHPRYSRARETARELGEEGFAIITGGGPGIMEAANRGARDAGVPSVGLGIELPHEQGMNEYVDLPLAFHYFFTRKVMFVRYASGFVVYPGGFGTLDELFEAATLRQTEKIRMFPIVLMGSAYWGGLVDWLRDTMLADGYIAARGRRRAARVRRRPGAGDPRGGRAPPPARGLIPLACRRRRGRVRLVGQDHAGGGRRRANVSRARPNALADPIAGRRCTYERGEAIRAACSTSVSIAPSVSGGSSHDFQ